MEQKAVASAFAEVQQLVNEEQHKQTNGPLKMKLFKLEKNMKKEAGYREEFTRLGGVDLLIKIVDEGGQGNVVSYAMKALLLAMCQMSSLEAMATEQEKFNRLWRLIYVKAGKVACHALAMLAIICEFAADGYEKAQTAAEVAAASQSTARGGHARRFEQLSVLCQDEDGQVVVNATRLLNVLLIKSLISGQKDALVMELQEFSLEKHVLSRKTELFFQSQEEREELQTLRAALQTRVLPAHATTPESAAQEAKSILEGTAWLVSASEAGQKSDGCSGLGARAVALDAMEVEAKLPRGDQARLYAGLTGQLRRLESQLSLESSRAAELEADRQKEELAAAARREKREAEIRAREEKLDALMNMLKQQAEEQRAAAPALKEQLHALQANQRKLMEQYEQAQELEEQKDYLKARGKLWNFYQSVQLKINEMMLAYKVLNSGMICGEEQNTAVKYIALAGENIPIPGAAMAAGIINAGLRYRDARKQTKATDNINSLAVSVTEMEKLSEETSRLLAFCFEEQILMCDAGPEGVLRLSHCGVFRILSAIKKGELTVESADESIIEQLVASTFRTTTKKRKGKLIQKVGTGLFQKTIKTERGDKWTEDGVFTRSAVRTLDGMYFSGGEARPEKYGYRLGSEKQVSGLQPSSTRGESKVPDADMRSPILKKYRSCRVQPKIAPRVLFSPSPVSSSSSLPLPLPLAAPAAQAASAETGSQTETRRQAMMKPRVSDWENQQKLEACEMRVAALEARDKERAAELAALQAQVKKMEEMLLRLMPQNTA